MLADIKQGHHVLETSRLPMQHENFKVCLCMCMCVYGSAYMLQCTRRCQSTALHISSHLPSSLKQDLLFFCCECSIGWILSTLPPTMLQEYQHYKCSYTCLSFVCSVYTNMGLHSFTAIALTLMQTVACEKTKRITKFLHFENMQLGMVIPGFDARVWETETGVLAQYIKRSRPISATQ